MFGIDVWMSSIAVLMSDIDEWMPGIAVLMSCIDRSILEMHRGGCGHFLQPNLLFPQTWQHDVTVRDSVNVVRINQESWRKLCELEGSIRATMYLTRCLYWMYFELYLPCYRIFNSDVSCNPNLSID